MDTGARGGRLYRGGYPGSGKRVARHGAARRADLASRSTCDEEVSHVGIGVTGVPMCSPGRSGAREDNARGPRVRGGHGRVGRREPLCSGARRSGRPRRPGTESERCPGCSFFEARLAEIGQRASGTRQSSGPRGRGEGRVSSFVRCLSSWNATSGRAARRRGAMSVSGVSRTGLPATAVGWSRGYPGLARSKARRGGARRF